MDIDSKTMETIKDLIKTQSQDGNWNYNEYMHGMVNGMIMIQAIIDGVEPVYLDAPDVWLKDVPSDGKTVLGQQE